MVFTIVITSIVTLVIAIVTYYKWSFQYWKRKNVPSVKTSFPTGSLDNLLNWRRNAGIQLKDFYDDFKSKGYRYGGLYAFTLPVFVALDPQLIKNILQQDFQHFVDRGFYHNERDDPLSANLFALGGAKWRTLRTKMTSAFTPGKIKTMFDILLECGVQMHKALEGPCAKRQPIDIKDVSASYTIDVIGSCGFGIECNSFKYPEAEFQRYAKTIFAPKKVLEFALMMVASAFNDLGRLLRIKFFKKETTDFFMRIVKDTMKTRETHNIVRSDMLQLLIDLKRELSVDQKESLTLREITAQVFIFFAAGFETSSTTMTFCLYELSVNQNLQDKVRDEINNVFAKHKSQITYDAIMDLKYMGQVVDETLRKYPPVSFITRKCVKEYKIPNTDVVLRKGELCVVPILGLHQDPHYYTDPDKFDPERFSVENKQKIQPFTYLPFGEGPRICIGLRLGLLQVKVGLAVLLRNYRVSLNKKTTLPITIDPVVFTMVPKSEVYLNIEKVDH